MLWADTMMGSLQPSLQVGEYGMADRQEFVGDLRIATLRDGMMVISHIFEAYIPIPIVRDDQRPLGDCSLDESAQR